VESGATVVQKDNGTTVGEPEEIRRFLAAELERKVAEIAEMALLVG
jgi:hypothetical protein